MRDYSARDTREGGGRYGAPEPGATVGKRTLSEQLPPGRSPIQTKLRVSAVGDAAEQEAESIGKRLVAAMHDPDAKPLVLRPTQAATGVERARPEPAAGAAAAGDGEVDVEGELARMRGGGAALPAELAERMGAGLGADLQGVRVHTGGKAHALGEALGARAFTSGRDIFFQQGEYDPVSPRGQELIAHELAHVVQQRGADGGADALVQRDPTDLSGILAPHRKPLYDAWVHYRLADSKIAKIVSRVEAAPNVSLVVTADPLPSGAHVGGNTRVEILANGAWVPPQRALRDDLPVGTPQDARFRIVIYVDPASTQGAAISVYIHEMLLHAEDFMTTIDEFRYYDDIDKALLHWQLDADTGKRSPKRQHDALRPDTEDYDQDRGEQYLAMHKNVTGRLDTSAHMRIGFGDNATAFQHLALAHEVDTQMHADIDYHTQHPNV